MSTSNEMQYREMSGIGKCALYNEKREVMTKYVGIGTVGVPGHRSSPRRSQAEPPMKITR